MLSFHIDKELTKQLISLNETFSKKNAQLKELSREDQEMIHQYAWVSTIGASTRIENAILTDSEVSWLNTVLGRDGKKTSFEAQRERIKNKLSKDKERSSEEVAGCRTVLLLIYEQAKNYLPLSESTIKGLHGELLRHYAQPGLVKGDYKNHPNSVVEESHKTGEKKNIFKTADPGVQSEMAMIDLVKWYNETINEEPWSLAVASELVFRFLAIHPFQDGNGRLGRALLIMSLLQSSNENLSNVTYYMAIDRQIEKHKEEYYIVLNQCSDGKFSIDPNKYKIEYFLSFMIKVLVSSLNDIDFYIKRVKSYKKLPHSALKVLESFNEMPEVRLKPKDIRKATELPTRTVAKALQILFEAEFIQRYGQGSATNYQILF